MEAIQILNTDSHEEATVPWLPTTLGFLTGVAVMEIAFKKRKDPSSLEEPLAA